MVDKIGNKGWRSLLEAYVNTWVLCIETGFGYVFEGPQTIKILPSSTSIFKLVDVVDVDAVVCLVSSACSVI